MGSATRPAGVGCSHLPCCCPAGAFLKKSLILAGVPAGQACGSLKEEPSVTLTSLSLSTGVLAADTLVTEALLPEDAFFLKVKPEDLGLERFNLL